MDEIMGNIEFVKCLSNISAATPVLSYFLSLQAANLAICTILDFYVDLFGNFYHDVASKTSSGSF